MRVIICGPRDWTDRTFIDRIMRRHYNGRRLVVISGCAPGIDTLAIEWAERCPDVAEIVKYPAEWHIHGKAAGPIRNGRMLKDGKPDRVIAFKYADRWTNGTLNMVLQAELYGVPVDTWEL